MCNTLIERATSMLAGGEIFRLIEQEQQREAVKLLETSLRVSAFSLLGCVFWLLLFASAAETAGH